MQQAVRLLHPLLTLSSAEADTPLDERRVTLGLDNGVQGVLEDLAALARARRMDLGIERCGGMPAAFALAEAQVQAHPVALHGIVINLVGNATGYTPSGGVKTTRIDAPAGGPVAAASGGCGLAVTPSFMLIRRRGCAAPPRSTGRAARRAAACRRLAASR